MNIKPFEPFSVCLDVLIRPCRREDLPTLEWFGLFAPERDLIRSMFERQQRGRAMMLIAEVNGVASGQAWIDFSRRDTDAVGVIWAARVFPSLQRQGIGKRLIRAAEQVLREQEDFKVAELSVEEDNAAARRLYERLGYHLIRGAPRTASESAPPFLPTHDPETQWLMRKDLWPSQADQRRRRLAAAQGSAR